MKTPAEIRAWLDTWMSDAQPTQRDYDRGLVVGFVTAFSHVLDDPALKDAARARCNEIIRGTHDPRTGSTH
jgi:hypothetical protein